MPTPMSAYAEIAARYQVDPDDEEAVTRFFEDTAPTLPQEERKKIFDELLAAHDGEDRSPQRRQYTTGTSSVRPREATLAAVPPRAYNPRRDGDELNAIARSITRWIDHYFRLLGMNVIASVTTGAAGQLMVNFAGADAAQLESKQEKLLDSMRSLLAQVAQVQPVIDIVEIRQPAVTDRATTFSGKEQVRSGGRPARVVPMDHIPVKAMSVEDAARTLEQSPDEFFVFRDKDNDKVRVIYKRSDRDLGLISE